MGKMQHLEGTPQIKGYFVFTLSETQRGEAPLNIHAAFLHLHHGLFCHPK